MLKKGNSDSAGGLGYVPGGVSCQFCASVLLELGCRHDDTLLSLSCPRQLQPALMESISRRRYYLCPFVSLVPISTEDTSPVPNASSSNNNNNTNEQRTDILDTAQLVRLAKVTVEAAETTQA